MKQDKKDSADACYAVFGRHHANGLTQMSIPLTMSEAKEFMRFCKAYYGYTGRRIRRLP